MEAKEGLSVKAEGCCCLVEAEGERSLEADRKLVKTRKKCSVKVERERAAKPKQKRIR